MEEDMDKQERAERRIGLVDCDDDNCEAKVRPMTLQDWIDAAVHWEDHGVGGGCSHGC